MFCLPFALLDISHNTSAFHTCISQPLKQNYFCFESHLEYLLIDMKNDFHILRENDLPQCIRVFVNLSIIFLVIIFIASSVSASDENNIWKKYGSKTLYKGDTYIVQNYKIEAYDFPIPDNEGYITNPSIFLKIYKDNNPNPIQEILLTPHESESCDEIKITAVDLPSGQVVELQNDEYQPWGKIEVAIKRRPKFDIDISTDKQKYQQNSRIKVNIIVRNEGNSDAKNVKLEYDTGGLEVDSTNIDKSHTRFTMGDSITGELNLKAPKAVVEKKTYTISVTVTGDDLEGDELSDTKSVSIDVLPDSGSIYVYSTPSGAKVSIDGADRGIAPLTIYGVSAGYHTIKLTKSGYEDYTENIYLSAGETKSISTSLVPSVAPTAQTMPTNPTDDFIWSYNTDTIVSSVSISDNGAYVAAGGYDGNVYLFTNDGKKLWNYSTDDYSNSVSISADGSYIAAGSANGVYLFNREGEKLWSFKTGDNIPIKEVSIAADGSYVAAGGNDHNVYLFNRAGEKLWSYKTGDNIHKVSISADGSYVAAGGVDYNVYLFNRAGEKLWDYNTGGYVNSLAISGDGSYLAVEGSYFVKVGHYDTTFYFFNRAGEKLWSYKFDVKGISISDDGSYVAAGDWNGNVHLFNRNGEELWNYNTNGNIREISLSADGSYVAAGGDSIYLFNHGGEKLWSYYIGDVIRSVSISADGSHVAAGAQDNKVYVFNSDNAPTAQTTKQTEKIGYVSIYSNPPNANIEIDGEYVGYTPRTISVPVGYHILKLTKSGHEDHIKQIYVSDVRAVSVSEKLVEKESLLKKVTPIIFLFLIVFALFKVYSHISNQPVPQPVRQTPAKPAQVKPTPAKPAKVRPTYTMPAQVKPNPINLNKFILDSGEAIYLEKKLTDSGKMSHIYKTSRDGYLAKIYKEPEEWQRKAIEQIVGKYNIVANKPSHRNYFCWPEEIIREPKLGVLMPEAPSNLETMAHFTTLDYFINRIPPERQGDWKMRVKIAIDMAQSMQFMHSHGLCHADISVNNILIDPVTGEMRWIDLDGLVIQDDPYLKPAVKGTKKYMAPEIVAEKALPSINTDLHSLAVLIYELLLMNHPLWRGWLPDDMIGLEMEGDMQEKLIYGKKACYVENPFTTKNRPNGNYIGSEIYGNEFKNKMIVAFVDGIKVPHKRVPAATWAAILQNIYNDLIQCKNQGCVLKYFSKTPNKKCPWCKK
jgi:WD40 repeat protein